MNLKLLLILLLALCGSSVPICMKNSTDMFEYKDKLYYFETFYKATWFKAFMACSRMGMELVSFDSNEEFDKVHEFVKKKSQYKFTDLSIFTSGVMKDIGQFHWINTGNPVLSTRWHQFEPNNDGGNAHCLQIWINNNRFLLDDTQCSNERFFICQSYKT